MGIRGNRGYDAEPEQGAKFMWTESSVFRCRKGSAYLLLLALCCLYSSLSSSEAQVVSSAPISYGYNGVFLAGGDGLVKAITAPPASLEVGAPWSLYCWVWLQEPISGPTLVAGMGDPLEEYARYFALKGDQLVFRSGAANNLVTTGTVAPKEWHLLAATFDGFVTHIYLDDTEVASGKLMFGEVSAILEMAPPVSPPPSIACFISLPRVQKNLASQVFHKAS